jgi:protein-S-isoprenylcysteine O-methyltransferase Ste14
MASWSKLARTIRVPLGFAFAVLYIFLAKPTARSMIIGAAVAIVGLAIRALASGHVQKNEQLATSGPYAYTRNPLYLGSLVLAVGFTLAARSWWIALAVMVFFFAIYIPVIRGEEKFLRERFPQFDNYAGNVPLLFPRLTAFEGNRGGFSWDLYWKHREYNSLLGSAVIAAALLVKLIWIK